VEIAIEKDISVRRASEREIYSITVLTRKFFPYIDFGLETILKRLRSKKFVYFVALYQGHTVGFVDIELKKKQAKILGLAVLEEFRGKGIGSALLKKAIDFAREKRKSEIVLLVSEANPAAQRIYEKFGFILRGKLRRKLGGQKILLYWLSLN